MDEFILDDFIKDLIEIMESHLLENNKGLIESAFYQNYWQGRFFESQDIKKDINKLLRNYNLYNKIEKER